MELLQTPIETLPKTAPLTKNRLKSISINTYFDLISYFPTRYEDYSCIITIKEMGAAYDSGIEHVTIKATVSDFENIYTRRHMQIQKVKLVDDKASTTVTWFNQPFLRQIFRTGQIVSVAGSLERLDFGTVIRAQHYEIDSPEPVHTARLVPIYPAKRGLSSRLLREKIYYLLQRVNQFQEMLSDKILKANNLVESNIAYRQIHFPDNLALAEQARDRLAFDELFTIQLSSALVRESWQHEKVGTVLNRNKFEKTLNDFEINLPFKLTKAQKRSIDEILKDISTPKPMNRLLQGDVGSGKTIVAAFAAYLTHLNGFKVLLMAPTEILASQHFQSLISIFSSNGASSPSIAIITSNKKSSNEEIASANIIVGTHAIIAGKRKFDNVGLVIVDEQQKFGVVQRAKLKEQGTNPHLLSMTATPIPRTVMLTLYGELDISILDEMPLGRLPVKTHLVTQEKRQAAYTWINTQAQANQAQIFIVVPLIDESTHESMKNIKAANNEYEKLSKEIFPNLKIGLLHGRMKSAEKDKVLLDFKEGKLDILVSTPVVEVGIDIPRATIIVIEGAERFGMAQLHQLRGRVGRDNKQSYCLLFTEQQAIPITQRLNFFSKVNDGFVLAQYDLEHRGGGSLHGIEQHGISELALSTLTDVELINKTQKLAQEFVRNKYSLDSEYPILKERIDKYHNIQIARD